MGRWVGLGILYLLTAASCALAASSCGSTEEDCGSVGGVICNNCARDCEGVQPTCTGSTQPACVGLSFFDGEPSDLRCAFCIEPEN